MSEKRTPKRGGVRSEECVFVGAWVPLQVVDAVDRAAEEIDSDRSKFIRLALKEKIAKREEDTH